MNEEEETGTPRRRVASLDVLAAREARRLVESLNDRIGIWQAESVRLALSLQRMRASGRHDPGLVEAAQVLLSDVEAQHVEFAAQLSGAEARIAEHSRIADTLRALETIAVRLRAGLASQAGGD